MHSFRTGYVVSHELASSCVIATSESSGDADQGLGSCLFLASRSSCFCLSLSDDLVVVAVNNDPAVQLFSFSHHVAVVERTRVAELSGPISLACIPIAHCCPRTNLTCSEARRLSNSDPCGAVLFLQQRSLETLTRVVGRGWL